MEGGLNENGVIGLSNERSEIRKCEQDGRYLNLYIWDKFPPL